MNEFAQQTIDKSIELWRAEIGLKPEQHLSDLPPKQLQVIGNVYADMVRKFRANKSWNEFVEQAHFIFHHSGTINGCDMHKWQMAVFFAECMHIGYLIGMQEMIDAEADRIMKELSWQEGKPNEQNP